MFRLFLIEAMTGRAGVKPTNAAPKGILCPYASFLREALGLERTWSTLCGQRGLGSFWEGRARHTTEVGHTWGSCGSGQFSKSNLKIQWDPRVILCAWTGTPRDPVTSGAATKLRTWAAWRCGFFPRSLCSWLKLGDNAHHQIQIEVEEKLEGRRVFLNKSTPNKSFMEMYYELCIFSLQPEPYVCRKLMPSRRPSFSFCSFYECWW